MIVNLKHLKGQWSVLPSFENACLGVPSPNPYKVLNAFTSVQLILQFVSFVLLTHQNIYFRTDGSVQTYFSTGLISVYTIGSRVSQILEITVTVYACYHLRNATFIYNYSQEINKWTLVNNIYLTTSIMFFIYIFTCSKNFLLEYIRVLISCLISSYKVYIVYQMNRNIKSSTIILEQNLELLENSPKPANSVKNSKSSQSQQSHVVVIVEH